MAKLIKTDPKDLILLQNAMYAHFVEDGIAINDVKTYEPRHRVSTINKSKDLRSFRIFLNILMSVAIISAAYFSGFYPLSLLLFLSLYDLRSMQRVNLPLNSSNFLPYTNIQKVELIKGKLGFNYAHIIIKDDNEKISLRKLKLYDSASTLERATNLFTRIGVLEKEEEVKKNFTGLEKITIGNGVEYFIDGDQLFLVENGKYVEKREDPYKFFRIIALIGLLMCLSALGAKLSNMIEFHDYAIVDFAVLAFFLLIAKVPFNLMRRTNPTVLNKVDISNIKETKKQLIINIKGWKGLPLVKKINKKYTLPADISKLKEFIEK